MVRTARLTLIVLLLMWAGIAIGVEFLATPVKFQARQLTTPVALEIGRVTFAALARCERILLVCVLALACLFKPGRRLWLLLGLIAAEILLAQLWLLPALDARVELILHGIIPPETNHHVAYATLEGLKCLLLLTAGIAALRERSAISRSQDSGSLQDAG